MYQYQSVTEAVSRFPGKTRGSIWELIETTINIKVIDIALDSRAAINKERS